MHDSAQLTLSTLYHPRSHVQGVVPPTMGKSSPPTMAMFIKIINSPQTCSQTNLIKIVLHWDSLPRWFYILSTWHLKLTITKSLKHLRRVLDRTQGFVRKPGGVPSLVLSIYTNKVQFNVICIYHNILSRIKKQSNRKCFLLFFPNTTALGNKGLTTEGTTDQKWPSVNHIKSPVCLSSGCVLILCHHHQANSIF